MDEELDGRFARLLLLLEVVDVLGAAEVLVDAAAAARTGVGFARRRPPPFCNSASSSISVNSVALHESEVPQLFTLGSDFSLESALSTFALSLLFTSPEGNTSQDNDEEPVMRYATRQEAHTEMRLLFENSELPTASLPDRKQSNALTSQTSKRSREDERASNVRYVPGLCRYAHFDGEVVVPSLPGVAELRHP